MRRLMTILVAGLSLASALAIGAYDRARAQEHPTEHPTSRPAAKPEVTIDALAQAIQDYIEEDAELKGGWFLVWDPASETPLALQLEKVHKDRLSRVGQGVYFACTDMKTAAGKMYDLDFFMEKTDGGLKVTEVTIHKEEGRPRYTWKEEKGLWVREEVQ